MASTEYFKGNVGGDWNSIMEPESPANEQNKPVYPYNNVISSECHFIEMDDTLDRERVRVQHKSNTFIEMHPDGTEVHKIWGDGYEIVLQNKKVLVKGSCTIAVDGNAAIEVKGNAFNTVKGNYTSVIEGNASITSKKNLHLQATDTITMAASSIDLYADEINNFGEVQQHGNFSLNESVTVQGNLTCTGVVLGMAGLGTPGSLVVGPQSTVYPTLAYLTPPRVEIMTTLMTAVTAIGITLNAGAAILATAAGAITASAGGAIAITSGGASSISAGGAVLVAGAGVVTVQAAGVCTVTGSVISLNAGITNILGLCNVTGIATALDFISLINPTPYSIHGHAPLALTPPVPI